MIHNPFPKNIGFATIQIANLGVDSLLPEERASLSPRAREKRIREFAAGRLAARQALAQTGFLDPYPLLICRSRMALWPEGYVGSISHSGNIAIATAAKNKSVKALGVDVERIDRDFDLRIGERISSPKEMNSFAGATIDPIEKTLLLFSAKESIYKAYYPLIGDYFGYDAVTLQFDIDHSCFFITAHYDKLKKILPANSRVEATISKGYVFTYIVEYHLP